VGLIVDTNVFIAIERRGDQVDLSPWGPSEDVFMSVVTVSELLMGVYRADNESRRESRSAFVESIIESVSVLDFTTDIARTHSQLHARLAEQGQLIGAHDLIIAATALRHQLTLVTDNVREFRRVPDLKVADFAF
jgi:predicted nucleic acid-binding protein